MKRLASVFLLLAVLGFSGALFAAEMADGEVIEIDKDAGKIKLKHGEIPNLEMPPMTMMFRVNDQALLDQVNVGDSVKFAAEKIDGRLTVTEIQPVR